MPFQTDALAGYSQAPGGPFEPNGANPILADDTAAVASAAYRPLEALYGGLILVAGIPAYFVVRRVFASQGRAAD